jgi:hypothetical protein
MYKTGIVSLLALAGCASKQPTVNQYDLTESYVYANSFQYDPKWDYQKLYEQSQIQAKTNVGMKYILSALLSKHNEHWRAIRASCNTLHNNELSDFKMVVAITSTGAVKNVQSSKNNANIDCFKSAIKNISYPKPPYKNFYFYISVN